MPAGERAAAEGGARLAATAVIIAHFAAPFMFSGVAVALPALGAELRAGASALGLVETLFLAGSVAFLLPVGRLADVSDRRALYRGGLLLFGAASLGIAASSSVALILALRLVQGIAAAVISGTGPAILADVVAPARRGRAYGAAIGVTYAGLSFGPLVGGLLVDHLGWRAVFVVGAGGLLAAWLLVRRLLPSRWRRPPRGAVHLPSVGLVVASVLALVFGSASVDAPQLGASLMVAGLLLAALFVALQRRLDCPLLDVDALVGNLALRRALLVQALLYMHAYAAMFLLSIYLQVALGRSAATAGQILALGSVLMAVGAPIAGALADRLRPALLASVGVAGVLLSALLGRLLGPDSSVGLAIAALAAQGLGFALFSSPNMKTIMNSVPAAAIGGASALGAKSRSLGMICGMMATAVLVALSVGDAPVGDAPERFLAAMRAAYTILTVSAALALIIALRGVLGRAAEGAAAAAADGRPPPEA